MTISVSPVSKPMPRAICRRTVVSCVTATAVPAALVVRTVTEKGLPTVLGSEVELPNRRRVGWACAALARISRASVPATHRDRRDGAGRGHGTIGAQNDPAEHG